ncbi:MAG: TIGR02206 family membrane protein [Candidatus Izimaplasma sp.]|nr:TIGR02206 family membrane protein [Candidatus Izimaplasma bacterium]
MKDFFTYESPYRTGNFITLSIFEYILPIALILLFAIVLIHYRNKIKTLHKVDSRIRIIVGSIFLIIYASHYLLRFNLYQFDSIILPFQLCSISMFLAIILLYTKNKVLYSFVLYTGFLGGIISLLTPIIGYDASYYRYYQFYIAHGLLILTPIYFTAVHDFYPKYKDTIIAFYIFQGLIVFMGIFNYFNGTDFMFVFLDATKIEKFPLIRYFGGIPFYIIPGEIAVVLSFYGMYQIMRKIEKQSVGDKKEVTYEVV